MIKYHLRLFIRIYTIARFQFFYVVKPKTSGLARKFLFLSYDLTQNVTGKRYRREVSQRYHANVCFQMKIYLLSGKCLLSILDSPADLFSMRLAISCRISLPSLER